MIGVEAAPPARTPSGDPGRFVGDAAITAVDLATGVGDAARTVTSIAVVVSSSRP
jgi:hypothetical protein